MTQHNADYSLLLPVPSVDIDTTLWSTDEPFPENTSYEHSLWVESITELANSIILHETPEELTPPDVDTDADAVSDSLSFGIKTAGLNSIEIEAHALPIVQSRDRNLVDVYYSEDLKKSSGQDITESNTHDIIFIDSRVENYQSLVPSRGDESDVFILDSQEDGIQQITDILAQQQNISSISIVSHGSSGTLELGSSYFDSSSFEHYTDLLQQWSNSLTTNADILLYGCHVAAGNLGSAFIEQLSISTGADVAASTDATGSQALGGNWLLEMVTGPIETISPFSSHTLTSYSSILPINTFVDNGTKVDIEEVGGTWIQGNGYIEQTGINKFLYADEIIPAGDFTITASLSLAELNGTAASFEIDGNHFGFEGVTGQFYTSGEDWGAVQKFGNPEDFIDPAQPFTFEVSREGSEVSFAIDGTNIHSELLASTALTNVGFRPWRNTMRIFDFNVETIDSTSSNAPTILSDGGRESANINVAEEQSSVTLVQANDPDPGDSITFSISGGLDATLFRIDSNTGQLRFTSTPDFENPTDSDGDNQYVVEVAATDNIGLFDHQVLYISVSDIDESATQTFVDNGNKVNVQEIGKSWIQGNGYIERSGINNFLYATNGISAGDFTITSQISLAELNGTAASFEIDGNHFGFEGASGQFYTSGEEWGAVQKFGDPDEFIDPGQPFTFEVDRKGSEIFFSINGTQIHQEMLNNGALTNVGFRPWRNTMRIFDFILQEFNGVPVPGSFFESQVFRSNTNGYSHFRIPTIIQAGNGDLLAFAEGRVNSRSDFGDIDIVMRRSTDEGRTWQPLNVIIDNGEDKAGNVSVVLNTQNANQLVMVYNTATHSETVLENGTGVREVWVSTSDDHGNTWSDPINITTSVHKPNEPNFNPAYNFTEDWRTVAVQPGHAIQLDNGRLIFGANFKLADKKSRAFSFHSDDHGQTWELGGISGFPGNENQIAQLSNGNLLMNARPHKSHNELFRQISVSDDYGESWTPFTSATHLPDPRVHGSILSFNPDGIHRMLFSNPASQTARENLVVRLSYDDGNSWIYDRIIQPGFAAYSDLVFQADNDIGVLYEGEGYNLITFANFDLAWLTEGQDILV